MLSPPGLGGGDPMCATLAAASSSAALSGTVVPRAAGFLAGVLGRTFGRGVLRSWGRYALLGLAGLSEALRFLGLGTETLVVLVTPATISSKEAIGG